MNKRILARNGNRNMPLPSLPVNRELRALFDEWRRWLEQEGRAAPLTYAAYRGDVQAFIGFVARHTGDVVGIATLRGLLVADFRAWLAWRHGERDYHRNSNLRALSAIRHFFRHLARQNLLDLSALEALRAPGRTEAPAPTPNAGEARELLAQAAQPKEGEPSWVGLRDAALWTLLYGAGLRLHEALGLPLTVYLHRRGRSLPIIGKGDKERRMHLLPEIVRAIDRYLAAHPLYGELYRESAPDLLPPDLLPDAPLFLGRRGGQLAPAVAQRRLAALRRRMGLSDRFTPHSLRHAFATHLYSSGAHLRAVQDLLGHASLATTQRYTRVESAHLLASYRNAHPRAIMEPHLLPPPAEEPDA